MTIRYSAASHIGRVRKVNEDSILSLPDQKIWVVADGMGGHAAGDFASQTIVDTIAMIEPDLPPGELMRGLRQTIMQAHATISAAAEERFHGTVGATVVALILTDEHFVALWAGDSRLYRFRAGKLEMLTTDHSLVAELVLSGELTWDQAEQHPQSNAITRAVGVGETLELDKIRGDVASGDRFLLCSDGLTKYATFNTLASMLNGTPIETVADRLTNFALDAGGADNISIIVVDVV
ncbi:PP2C family serine/threonine-protein phosphatase [Pseudorhodobacter sp.]|uniref:PP2C family protein-serine/threonine phosphatase n=1 Tax=Pseudorhodobacter sp. TaxID=1934400 RepID=UPI002648AD89|nr:protein phosphatase 2C domain-containing protein [Pseudorhodobacter sp.]MDN5788665.1 protein phosphatase 2C domain-containing protein [Pseudorhodobacter sp.]